MMSLTFGLFTQVSGSGPLGPLVFLQFEIAVVNKTLVFEPLKFYCIGIAMIIF